MTHPVVRVHPVTGRKVLFVNPQFTVGIKNMDERESKALLEILYQQAAVPEYQFRHHWAPHTLIMWDNRSTQHYAVNDYFPQRRYMERVTVKGGSVDGVERADPETVRKAIRRQTGKPKPAHGKPQAPVTPATTRSEHATILKRTHFMPRICNAVFAAAVVALLLPSAASSQTWPSRPVTIMMPQPAGGIADLLARGTAQALSDEFGQPFIVENRLGASGNLAAAAVAKSAPDGSIFLYATQAQVAFNKLMFASLPYDPARDFVPVIVAGKSPVVFVASMNGPSSLPAMIEMAKAKPGQLTIGQTGVGSMSHVAYELLQLKTGIVLNGVPYKGGAPMATDLLGGHLPLGSDLLSNFINLAKEKKVRLLAVASAKRFRRCAGRPDRRGRDPSAVRGGSVVCDHGAGRHAGRHRAEGQRGRQPLPAKRQGQGADRWCLARTGRRLACRSRGLHQARARDVGAGDQGGEYFAQLTQLYF